MHYFEFATKDTTIYEASASINTGKDEILEIRKDIRQAGDVVDVSRALIKFDLTYISSSIASGLITSGSSEKFYLNLYDANSNNLNIEQYLYAYPVSQSWIQGSGRSDSNPKISDGCSWNYKDNDILKTQWSGLMTGSGGTWHSGSGYESSQLFVNEAADLRMDVTDITWKWLKGTIPNEGFMIKRSGSIGNTNSNVELSLIHI